MFTQVVAGLAVYFNQVVSESVSDGLPRGVDDVFVNPDRADVVGGGVGFGFSGRTTGVVRPVVAGLDSELGDDSDFGG